MARFTKPYERYAGKFYEIDLGDDVYILKFTDVDAEFLVFAILGIVYKSDQWTEAGAFFEMRQQFTREFDGHQKKVTPEVMKLIYESSHQIIKDIFKAG